MYEDYIMFVPDKKIVDVAKMCSHLGNNIEFNFANKDKNSDAEKLFFDTIEAEKNRSSKISR
jgi:Rieske Fe-S protein